MHGGIDGLHAGCTVAHDGVAGHVVSATEPQGYQSADVHLVGCRSGAPQDNFRDVGGLERLPQNKLSAGLHCQVGSTEGPGHATGLQKGAAGSVDDVDGLILHRSPAGLHLGDELGYQVTIERLCAALAADTTIFNPTKRSFG